MRVLGTIVLVGMTLIALPSRADDASEREADALLKQGVELRVAGRDSEALAAFKRALALSPSPRARAQVALAEQALNLWLESEEDLSQALAAKDDAWVKQNRPALERAARVIQAKLAWLVVTSNVAGASLFVNGRRMATVGAGARTRVVAGQVAIELRAEGKEPVSRTLQVVPETEATVSIDFLRDAAPPPAADRPVEPAHDGSATRTLGFVGLGVGAAAIAVGGYFGVRAITLKSDRDAECKPDDGCTDTGKLAAAQKADSDGRTAGLVSTIAIGAGAALAGVGLYLVLSSSQTSSVRVAAGWKTIAVHGSF